MSDTRRQDEAADRARSAGDACRDDVLAVIRRPVELPHGARERLAARLAGEPPPHRAAAGAGTRGDARSAWLVRPLSLRVPPLALGAIAAGLVAIGVLGHAGVARAPARAVAATAASPDTVRLVRFVLVDPAAARVALVGDFNGWDASRTPMRAARAGGIWTVELRLPPGRHTYAFVVDGGRWVVDPAAPLAPEDGFGTPNSVIVVGGET
jgi:hypothetical protein